MQTKEQALDIAGRRTMRSRRSVPAILRIPMERTLTEPSLMNNFYNAYRSALSIETIGDGACSS
jgi:hypothetical protein